MISGCGWVGGGRQGRVALGEEAHSVIERDTLERQSIDHDGLCLDDDRIKQMRGNST